MATAIKRTDKLAPSTVQSATVIVATDGELLMRFVRHRDHWAFAEIVERHGRLVWMICRQVLRHHQDVEDAFQATFLILAQRARTIRASDSAAAWLYKVAMRTAMSARRKRQRRREEPLVADPPVGPAVLPIIDDREMLYVLLQEMRTLPERYQTPLVMRYLEGQSRRAIAEQTDSTISQIQGRLARGRRLLRSRFLRRGVSLSLAAGAVASTSASANAAITPTLVESTAETCLAIKNSGAVSGLSPAVLELTREGVKAMWVAFVTKCTAVVSAIVLAGGIVWAAQQAGSDGAVGGDAARVQVNLLSATDKQDAEKDVTPEHVTGSGNAIGKGERAAFLAGRLKYKVPVEIGDTEFNEGGRIAIEEVWGTRPRIEVGGQYMVRGKYVLPPRERGKLYFYESATGPWGQPMPDVDLQTATLDKESGEFTLLHEMRGPGYFHLYLASPEKYSHYFANVYFGTGDNVLRKNQAAVAGYGENKQGSTVAVARDAERRTADAAKQREESVQKLKRQAEDLMALLSEFRKSRSEKAASLEMEQFEKSMLQRALERLREKLAEADIALDMPVDEKEKKEVRQKQSNVRDIIAINVQNLEKVFQKRIKNAASLSNDVEQAQLEVTRAQSRLEELDRRSIQLEFPQEQGTKSAAK